MKEKKSVTNKTKQEIDFNQFLTNPNISNGIILERMMAKQVDGLDIYKLAAELKKQGERVNKGDLAQMEQTLVSQVTSLQVMFTALVNRAQSQEYLKQFETYMRLALKAQAQSRATMQALIELKYPRQMIVSQQTNIAQQQQVNNGTTIESGINAGARACTGGKKNQIEQNKLMGNQDQQYILNEIQVVTNKK